MSTATITTRTRMIIQDTGQPFIATAVQDAQGITTIFNLPVESISMATTPIVTVNGVPTTAFTLDYKFGVIQFSAAPPANATIAVSGVNYEFFDDDEVTQAVTDGFNLHVQDQDPLPVIDPGLGQTGIPNVEEYLVAIMAARELLWFRATDSAQQVDVHTPEGVTIPRSQRYRQIVEQISALESEYKELAGALGIGLFHIQVVWQRRVSLTTNRLVPLYKEQEYNQPYTGFVPTSAPVGGQVTINGQYFTGASAVTFGGVPAVTWNVQDDKTIIATVPVGAQTGQIGVQTPYGVVLSTAQFVVGQPAPQILYGPEVVTPPIPPGV